MRRRDEDPFRAEVLDVTPLDDEPLTEADLAAIRVALAQHAQSEVIAHADVCCAVPEIR